jgi:hypothetical protein
MKLPLLIIACLLVSAAASALFLPQLAPPGAADIPALKSVASFERGERYQAGTYPVIVLNGSFREMGRQYGGLMKNELTAEHAMITSSLEKRGYTADQIRAMGRDASAFQPERQKEVSRGIAETTGLSEEDVYMLYDGPIFYLMAPETPAACSFLAVWGDYTTDGSVVLSRNWDLPDAIAPFDPYYVLVVYRPSDGSNGVATFGPAGTRPETLMNSKGLFIADDNAGESAGNIVMDNRPDLISEFFRLMLDYSDLRGLDAGIQGTRPNLGWIVNAAGPEQAYIYEVTIYDMKQRTGDGVIAAANHFVDPSWHFEGAPAEHTASRYNNLLRQAKASKGLIDAQRMMQIRDVLLDDGGATFRHSMLFGAPYSSDHQVVFVPKTRTVWLKVVDRDWQKVELGPLFGN